jgi:hypothetical protein
LIPAASLAPGGDTSTFAQPVDELRSQSERAATATADRRAMTKLIAVFLAVLIAYPTPTHSNAGPAPTQPPPLIGSAPASDPRPVIDSRASQTEPTPRAAVTAHNAGADQLAILGEALSRFRDNGLDLPELDVWFSDDRTACKGNYGLFQAGYEPKRITVCTDFDFILTHELAHAWIDAHVDETVRVAYTEARQLESWNDPDIDWYGRATEDAAKTIQQNLMAPNPPPGSARRQERIAAYELLTGGASPLAP